jgi:hypothetical protein
MAKSKVEQRKITERKVARQKFARSKSGKVIANKKNAMIAKARQKHYTGAGKKLP